MQTLLEDGDQHKLKKGGREMKRIFILTVMMAMVLGFSVQAQATLILKGTDTLGNRLIY
ncbi:MAG: hypothetical protein AABY65_04390 [Nitrospirota bacterium]